MAYSKKYYEGLKKSLKEASADNKRYWQTLIESYEEMYPLNIKYDTTSKFYKK